MQIVDRKKKNVDCRPKKMQIVDRKRKMQIVDLKNVVNVNLMTIMKDVKQGEN